MSKRERSIGPSPPARSIADHLNFSAPFRDGRAEYYPSSPRTGRMVSQATAEAEFSQSFDGIGTEDHEPGGLWDFSQEPRQLSSRWPHKAEGRYDDERMTRFADEHSSEFTDLELQVYTLFWPGKMSYGAIASRLHRTKDAVRQAVQRLRARADGRTRGNR